MSKLISTQEYFDSNNNKFKFIPINARVLMVEFTGNHTIFKDKHNSIKHVDVYSRKFEVGETVKIEIKSISYLYKVNFIEHIHSTKNKHSFHLIVDKVTNASYFLFPAVADNKVEWMYDHFINAYMYIPNDFDISYDGPSIFLLYRYNGDRDFYDFEKRINNNESVMEVIDVGPDILIMIKVPKRFHDDYYKVTQSKYSEISDELKERLLSLYKFGPDSVMANVLSRSESRRKSLEAKVQEAISPDAELWDLMDMESETFRLHLIPDYVSPLDTK